jgi:hypothetical protein
MPFLILGAIVVGAVLIYRTVRPMMRSGQKYDAGAVSENWLQQQRGQSDDQTR